MRPTREFDITIIGAGPAGAALALTLAPRHRVMMVDRVAEPGRRIGESLIPAARRLLRDMRILDAHEACGHPAYLGNHSHWGEGRAQTTDFLRDPDGSGWHLNRAAFERFLRSAAAHRGAGIMAPARMVELDRSSVGWDLSIRSKDEEIRFHSRLLVDATGRAATVAKRLGAGRENIDRLASHWLAGHVDHPDRGHPGFSIVESAADGWWYSAPLASGERVLAFHTDADIVASIPRDAAGFLDRARRLRNIGRILGEAGFSPTRRVSTTAANSARLSRVAGDGWLAIGDAALSFDPIASRGLFNALYTAWSGAMACHDALTGRQPDFQAYAEDLETVWAVYLRHLSVVYGAETRWPGEPFWGRRRLA